MQIRDNTTIKGMQGESPDSYIHFLSEGSSGFCTLRGDWSIANKSGGDVRDEWQTLLKDQAQIQVFNFRLDNSISWDSTLVSFLINAEKTWRQLGKIWKLRTCLRV
jgi:hypothetical protein